MAVYNTPGVYVQETLQPLGNPNAGPGRATAAFVGLTLQGPTTPTLVTSWNQYTSLFGGFGSGTGYMPFSVYAFFANGGSQCYIVRAVNANAVTASVQLQDIESPSHAGAQVNCISPGAWGNTISVAVIAGQQDRFDLEVRIGGTTDASQVERFVDVCANPADPRYVVAAVNSNFAGSRYIHLIDEKIATSGWTYEAAVDAWAPVANAPLIGGSDGTGSPDLVAATTQLNTIPGALDVNLPGISTAATINGVTSWASARGTAFVVVDGQPAPSGSTSSQVATQYLSMTNGAGAILPSSYCALYAPYLWTADPSSSLNGAMRLLPPGGAVLGQYSATDALRGPQKPAAGINNSLVGVLDLETRFITADTDALNEAGIDAIRLLPTYGFCIFGARTLLPNYPSRYLSVRRTLIVLENDLVNLTRFAVFEPNGPILWQQVTSVVTAYLQQAMQAGMLAGSTPPESYSVTCDETNNPPSQTSIGFLNVDVSVALLSPAEFVIIHIGQLTSSVTTTTTVP